MSVQIFKNGKLIQTFPCTQKNVNKVWDKAYDIAGGMWNGKDKFLVKIVK